MNILLRVYVSINWSQGSNTEVRNITPKHCGTFYYLVRVRDNPQTIRVKRSSDRLQNVHFSISSIFYFSLITKNNSCPIIINIPVQFCPTITQSLFPISGDNCNFLRNRFTLVPRFEQPPSYSAGKHIKKPCIIHVSCDVR